MVPRITNRAVYCLRCEKLSIFEHLTNGAYCTYCDITYSLRQHDKIKHGASLMERGPDGKSRISPVYVLGTVIDLAL